MTCIAIEVHNCWMSFVYHYHHKSKWNEKLLDYTKWRSSFVSFNQHANLLNWFIYFVDYLVLYVNYYAKSIIHIWNGNKYGWYLTTDKICKSFIFSKKQIYLWPGQSYSGEKRFDASTWERSPTQHPQNSPLNGTQLYLVVVRWNCSFRWEKRLRLRHRLS